MFKQFKSAVVNAIPEYFCLFDYMENICSAFLICFNDSAGVQNLPLANTTPAMSAAQSLSNVQQLVKQTTQLMPCSWQLYEPPHFVFSLHLHPHMPSVQCAETMCWKGTLIVKGNFAVRSTVQSWKLTSTEFGNKEITVSQWQRSLPVFGGKVEQTGHVILCFKKKAISEERWRRETTSRKLKKAENSSIWEKTE